MFRKRIRPIYILITSYLLTGLVHVFIPETVYTNLLALLLCGISVCFWAISLDIKIIEKRVKTPLITIAGLLIFFFVLQSSAYVIFAFDPLWTRVLWYAYYIPMICVPLLILFISFYIYNNYSPKSKIIYRTSAFVGVVLIILVLTNEIHRLAFYSDGGVVNKDHYYWGPVYHICVVFISLIYIASIIMLLKKAKDIKLRSLMWRPCLVVVISTGAFVVVQTLVNTYFGIKIWNIGETFALCTIAYIEICIYMGLIPSNEDYNSLFKMIPIPVQIKNIENDTVVASKQELVSGEYIHEFEMDIYGGKVQWTTDLTKLNELNNELEEINNSLISRNSILQTENSIKENREALESRNNMYSSISRAISSQLSQIEALFDDEETDFNTNLAMASVLNAYIKRCSNLMIIKEDCKEISLVELQLSIGESLEYIGLLGASTGLNCFSKKMFPIEMIIQSYEFFENVVEKCMYSLQSIVVFIGEKEEVLEMRILLNADTFSFDFDFSLEKEGYKRKASITQEDGDTLIVFSIEKGGNI